MITLPQRFLVALIVIVMIANDSSATEIYCCTNSDDN